MMVQVCAEVLWMPLVPRAALYCGWRWTWFDRRPDGTAWASFDARGIADKLRAVQIRLGVRGVGFEYPAN